MVILGRRLTLAGLARGLARGLEGGLARWLAGGLALGLALALTTGAPAAAAETATETAAETATETPTETVAASDAWRWPLDGPPSVVREFSPPPTRYAAGHRGVDLAGSEGQPVLAAGPGMVAFAGILAGRGVVSVVHTGGRRTTYEPVLPVVQEGQHVTVGERLGTLQAGHPGCPVTACLHWGLRVGDDHYLDPRSLLDGGPVRLLPWWPAGSPAGWPLGRALPGAAAPAGRPAPRASPAAATPRASAGAAAPRAEAAPGQFLDRAALAGGAAAVGALGAASAFGLRRRRRPPD